MNVCMYINADFRSMCYLPSVIATVTMLYVINSIEPPCIGLEYQTQILAILGIDKVTHYLNFPSFS